MISLEKPRGGLLHQNPDVGARSPDADALRDPQHGAAATLLQHALSGFQQQESLRPGLRPQPHRCRYSWSQRWPQTREPEGLLESSETDYWGDGGKRLSGGAHQDMRALQQDRGITTSTRVTNLNLYISEQGNPNGINSLYTFCIYIDNFTFQSLLYFISTVCIYCI